MSGNLVITVQQGKLKGNAEETKNGFKFNSYLGIPYAKPPVGPLRFKSPEPATPWQGIRDATQEGSNCYSKDLFTNQISGSEDCLFINVYTPETSYHKKPKAVMVLIHGGAYIFGSSQRLQYGPEYLIEKNIVLVSFNYRLGILGFISVENQCLEIPGNAGLKDQVLALKWIQENISAFGGDRNNVTIFGNSAGAGSVHFLVLSSQAKGLFHKAIMQSGTAISPWSFGMRNAIKMCELLGKPVTNEADAVGILKKASVSELIEAQNKYPDLQKPGEIRIVAPVIENCNNKDTILSIHPLKQLKSGSFNKVPILIGYTSGEGLIFEMLESVKQIDLMNDNFEIFIPINYGIIPGSTKAKEIANRIKVFYYKEQEPNKKNKHILYRLISHMWIVRGIYATIEETLKHSSEKLFLYKLSLECELNQLKIVSNIQGDGVAHAEDLFYLFYHSLMTPEIKKESIEDIAIQRLTTWWSNFAKYGDPNGIENNSLLQPKWPNVDADKLQCMNIDVVPSIQFALEEKYMKFWQAIEEYAFSS